MLSRNFTDFGLPVGVTIDSESSAAMRIRYPEADSEWKLVMKRDQPVIELLRNTQLALESIRDDGKNKGKPLEYLDVRLGQKLFSKFKEQE